MLWTAKARRAPEHPSPANHWDPQKDGQELRSLSPPQEHSQTESTPCLFKGTNTDHSTGFAVVPFTHTVAVMENNWLATNNDTGWGMKGCNLQIPRQKPQFLWRSHPSTTLKRLVCKYREILINLVHFWVHFILKYVQIVCRCYSNDVLGWVPCCVQDLLSKVQTVNTDVIFPPFASNADPPGLKNGSWFTALPGSLQGNIPLGVAVKHSKKVVIRTCHYHTAERQTESDNKGS